MLLVMQQLRAKPGCQISLSAECHMPLSEMNEIQQSN